MARAPGALENGRGLLAVVVLAIAVTVHAQAPAASPKAWGPAASPSSVPSSSESEAPAGAPASMEMETLWLHPARAPALGGSAGAPQEDAPALAPWFANEAPKESPAGAPQTIAGAPLEHAPSISMAPFWSESMEAAPVAFAPGPLWSESLEGAPAGAPEVEAEAPGPASEMASAPSSEDYDVLQEEALAPAGEGPSSVVPSDPATGPASPAPGPASDDDASGASATPRSLVVVLFLAAVSSAVAAY